MGGANYETPYPVKRQDGSKIIWNWNTKEWEPYDEAAAKKNAPATPTTPGERGGDTSGAPGPGGPVGGAPDRYGGGDRNPGDVNSSPGPTVQQRKRRRAQPEFQPPGTTLLTARDAHDF